MSIQVKFRRGTSTQHNSFTGANGEITVDTTNKTLRVHDGVTVGGIRIAKFSEVSAASGNTAGYLQVANATALYATKGYAAANTYVKSILANTNSRINLLNTNLTGTNTAVRTVINTKIAVSNAISLLAAKAAWTELIATNTALRTLVSDRIQVANAAATYQTITTERAALANTNAFIKTQLANTNAYIATKATWAGLTGTNTTLRTLISDRYQVANVNNLLAAKATWTGLTGTNTAIRALVSDRYQVANVNTLLTAKATWNALTSTNTVLRILINDKLQVSNATTQFNTKASWVALTGTNTALRILINDRYQIANVNILLAAKATWTGLTGTNTALRTLISDRYQVANVNTLLAAKATWTGLTGTNTALRSLISDRMQVANVRSYLQVANAGSYMQVANVKLILANTNSYIASKVSTTTFNLALANTNAYIASVSVSGGGATWSALTSTNTALRALISDRMQVANTNTLVNGRATWSALTGTNTALRTLISDRYQVANVNSNFLKKTGTVAQTITPNVNFSANVSITGRLTVTGGITSYFANNVSTGDNMIYLNANSTVSNPDVGFAANYNDGSYHHTGFFRDASDAGTFKVFENYALEPDASPYIDTTHASFRLAPFKARDIRATGILSVTANSSLGNTSVSGFLKLNGGADIRAVFAQNTYVKSTLANTNLRVNLINTNLTGTNTALRTLVSDRYQVANVNTLLAAKATWAALTSTNTAIRAYVDDHLQVANAVATYLTKNNPIVTGTLTANGTAGTSGYYLRTSGTGIYWSPVAGGGGSAANGFSGILVGANVAVAGGTTSRLTLVAGSGITIAADPATDTITFASTGGSSGGYTRTTFTATAGQTSFSATYTVNYVEVYLNGILLNSADYTATTGTTVVLAAAAAAGDIVDVVALNISFTSGVTASGTPTSGQLAAWTGATSIQGINSYPVLQGVQTTSFAAVAGRAYPVNTTSGAVTVTLPASPSAGQVVQVIDYAGTFGTNACTVSRNGSNINGLAANSILNISRESVSLVYVDATQGWVGSSAFIATNLGQSYTASYLNVAGGGGGGGGTAYVGGGGGGAGGLLSGTTTFTPGTVYTIVIGAGGAGGATGSSWVGTSGSASSITSLTSTVGGGGGAGSATAVTGGLSGGSGGGSAGGVAGGAGTSGQGNAGGGTSGPATAYGSNGGGGAGAVGGTPTSTTGGSGGIGTTNSLITTAQATSASVGQVVSSSIYYAGGGGGGVYVNTPGAGGSGGGGAGTLPNTIATAGTVNSGGGGGGTGGGGSSTNTVGGAGGSGVVLISVPTVNYSGAYTGTPTVVTNGSNTVLIFKSSGSYTA